MKKTSSIPFVNILLIFVCILLIVNFFRATTEVGSISFYSLLQTFGAANETLIPFTSRLLNITIGGDWGLLNGLRDFFNIFGSIFSVAIFLSQNILASINFVVNFVALLLVV